MSFFLIFLILLGSYTSNADYSALSYEDRPCGTDLYNLWLDVVAVVDTSIRLTNDGLDSVAVNIAKIFNDGTRIGTNPNEPRTTRFGLVTYNYDAEVKADLNKYQSIKEVYTSISDDLGTLNTTFESYLAKGLNKANDLFDWATGSRRKYRKVIIVFAASVDDNFDLQSVANQLKNDGITIITMGFDWGTNQELLDDLSGIGTPSYNFSNMDPLGFVRIQSALLEANCFCPGGWIQYHYPDRDYASHKFGVCLLVIPMMGNRTNARQYCLNIDKNTYLVNEYNQVKHDFVLKLVNENLVKGTPYHIGLHKTDGFWKWDQPVGWTLPYLKNWYGWGQGFPIETTSSSMIVVMNNPNGKDSEWQNIEISTLACAVCEMPASDTDNFVI